MALFIHHNIQFVLFYSYITSFAVPVPPGNDRFQSPVSIVQIQDIQHIANDLGDQGKDRKVSGDDGRDVAVIICSR